MATLDDDHSVAIMLVPAAVQPAVMSIELGRSAAEVIAVAIVVPVASDPEPETFSARYRRRCNRDGCQRGENVRHLLHVASPLVAQGKTIGASRRSGNWSGTFLNGCSARLRVCNGSLRGATYRFCDNQLATSKATKQPRMHRTGLPWSAIPLTLLYRYCYVRRECLDKTNLIGCNGTTRPA